MVNSPGNPKAHHWTGGLPGPDQQAWPADATRRQGSWWEAWSEWLRPHAGKREAVPGELSSIPHPVVDPPPGRYVRDPT